MQPPGTNMCVRVGRWSCQVQPICDCAGDYLYQRWQRVLLLRYFLPTPSRCCCCSDQQPAACTMQVARARRNRRNFAGHTCNPHNRVLHFSTLKYLRLFFYLKVLSIVPALALLRRLHEIQPLCKLLALCSTSQCYYCTY